MANNADQIAKLRKLYDQTKSMEVVQEITRQIERLEAEDVENPLLVGIGSGMTRVGQDIYGLGVGAGEMMGIADEGAFDEYRQGVHEERALMDPLKETDPWAAKGGEVIGEIAAALPFGGITGATAKQIPQFMPRLATNIGIGAGQGALGADDPAEGAAWGVLGSAVGQTVGDTVGLFGRQGDMVTTPRMEDVTVMRADDPASVYATMETGAQFSPSGRGTVVEARRSQWNEFEEAVSRMQDDFGGPGVSEFEESLKRVKTVKQGIAGEKYDEVGRLMENTGVDNAWRIPIMEQIDDMKSIAPGLQDRALIDRLEEYVKFTGADATASWNELRKLRSLIGRDVSDTYKGGALIGTTDTPPLMTAKRTIEGALDESALIETGGVFREADQYYKSELVPYKKGPSIIKDIMNKQTPGEMIDAIMKKRVTNNPQLVNTVMNALDEPGKAALRGEMLTRAFEKSAEGRISPATSANFINANKEMFTQMFPGEDIDGLIKFMRQIKRAAQAENIPQTGMGAQIGQGMLPGSLMGAGALAGSMDLMATGGLVLAGMSLPVLWGKILAAGATGKPGAMGKIIKEVSKTLEPTGRLTGQAVETDE